MIEKEYRPRLTEDEYESIRKYRGIKDAADSAGIETKDVTHGWLKTQTASLSFKNPSFIESTFDPDKIDWDGIISGIDFPKVNHPNISTHNGIFDRLVFTDTHVGMDVNKDGFSQYGGMWDEDELRDRCNEMINTISIYKNSNILVIDDLGDLMDGWDGQTARKHHDLPQNMDNQKAFDVALSFKLSLLRFASETYEKVIVNNICEDNHSSSYGYIVNSALKVVSDKMFDNVNVTNHRRFMNHYKINDNVFIITHGKDSKNLKFGLTPKIKPDHIEKINDYIDENFLYQDGIRIELSKGDSHQHLFDWDSSNRFDYFNFPALSPSSSWIQNNYKKHPGGFVFFNYNDTNDYIPHIKRFEWKK